MPGIDPVSTGIEAGLGLAQTAVGIINAGKTKREAAKLEKTRPQYEESPYAKQGLSLAQSELANGMSAQAKNAYEQGSDRDLSTSLDAILKGGGSVNNVAQVFDSSAQGRQRLTLMQENLRLNKINNLTQAQNTMEQERKNAFSYNQFNPWADKAQANAAARAKAQEQIWGGLQTAAGAAAGGFANKSRQQQQNDYFDVTTPPSSPSSGFSVAQVESPNYNFNNFTTPMASLQNTNPTL